MPATKNTQDKATDIPVTEDGSVVVEGTDYGTLRSAGSKVIGSLISALDKADGASLAGALLLGIIATMIRDADGFPVWSKGDWPETASKLFGSMLEDAGLSEDDGKRFTNAVRSAWSRSTGPCNVRDAFVALYVAGTVSGAKVMTTGEVSTVAQQNHAAALDILGPELVAMLPEELQAGPYNVSTCNAALKRGAAEQLHHFKLTVPVRFGGTPKDSSGTQDKLPASAETQLVDTATQSVSGHVGTDGGPSFVSVATGSLAVGTAFVAEIITAAEITDRAKVRETVQRNVEVLSIGLKYLDGKATDKDAEQLSAIGFLPEQDN